MSKNWTRRAFLARAGLGGLIASLAGLRPSAVRAATAVSGGAAEHPDPRPGIDAEGVLPRSEVEVFGEAVADIYDMVREMPQIADGIGCTCGCSALPGYRSLLTCYSEGGMAMGCLICQGTARLVHGRWKEGQDLERIRRACDARFG
jgi:hypothetical protein